MANYVKFKRGTPEAYAQLGSRAQNDTLYFIYKEGELTADLYLGSRLISKGNTISENLTNLNLSNLTDISIDEPESMDVLTYNSETEKWENQSIEMLLDSYNPSSPTVIMIENIYTNTHEALIKQECDLVDEKTGDIIIIKDPIDDNHYQHTGYVYNGKNWVALDGNYSANTVYFENDLVVTSTFGRYEPDSSGNIVIPAKGMNLQELLEDAYSTEDKTNLIISNPSASVNGSIKYYEIGSTGSQDIIVALGSDGEYKYGYSSNPLTGAEGDKSEFIINDKTTGITLDTTIENPCILEADGINITPKESKGSIFTLTPQARLEKSEMSVIGTVYHTQGHIPVSNLGKMYPSERIAAGSKSTAATPRARWYFPMYQGFTYADTAIESPSTITAEQLNNLGTPTASSNGAVSKIIEEKAYNQIKTTTATAEQSWRQYFLAFPASYHWEMTQAKDANNIDCTVKKANDITLTFGEEGNQVEIVYNVYYIHNAADYGTLKINWTL